jgi:hypothetical protein
VELGGHIICMNCFRNPIQDMQLPWANGEQRTQQCTMPLLSTRCTSKDTVAAASTGSMKKTSSVCDDVLKIVDIRTHTSWIEIPPETSADIHQKAQHSKAQQSTQRRDFLSSMKTSLYPGWLFTESTTRVCAPRQSEICQQEYHGTASVLEKECV